MKFTPWENPMGTEGFEFIEYAAPDPAAMAGVFERMGFRAIARHRHKEVTLYRQGEINFILNADPESFAQRFARLHRPSVRAIAFRVQDAASAYRRATSLGAWGFANHAGPGELNIPASKGGGGPPLTLVRRRPGARRRGRGGLPPRCAGAGAPRPSTSSTAGVARMARGRATSGTSASTTSISSRSRAPRSIRSAPARATSTTSRTTCTEGA